MLALTASTVGIAGYGVAAASEASVSGGRAATLEAVPEEGEIEVAESGGGCELAPEDLAEANAEEDALAAFLDERGVHHTREAGADGVGYVTWDEDDEAADHAVEEHYAAQGDESESCVVAVG